MIGNAETFWNYFIAFPIGVILSAFEFPESALIWVTLLILAVLVWRKVIK